LCVPVAVRDGLRSGDVYVPGSRRYADPASFLLTPEAWAPQRAEFCDLVGKPAGAADALAQAEEELHVALASKACSRGAARPAKCGSPTTGN
jgi:hypothetical protein